MLIVVWRKDIFGSKKALSIKVGEEEDSVLFYEGIEFFIRDIRAWKVLQTT